MNNSMDTEVHTRHNFSNGETLACALADRVADNLNDALAKRGEAVLALSGGSTPQRFMSELSRRDVDWPKVTLTLVDERWVPPAHERSNEKLVRDFLMKGGAAKARFVSLYCDTETPDLGQQRISASLPPVIDVAVLGLGLDGHTASFFPDGDNLAAATDPDTPQSVISMRASGAGEPRMTLTLSKLMTSGVLYLHIEGQQKADVLSKAYEDGPIRDLPIRSILHQHQCLLEIFWAP